MSFCYLWAIWAEMSGRPLIMGESKADTSVGGSHWTGWDCLKQQKYIQSQRVYRDDNSYYIYTFIGSVLGVHWKDWCWSWNSSALATWCEELTHLKRPWCCKILRAGGEGDDRRWDAWMASPTQWTWVWVDSGSWWWIGRPGVLWFMGSQRIRHDWATELNCLEEK